MQTEIIAYKVFSKGLINRYGIKFEVGKFYQTFDKVRYGTNGHGFHMSLYLENGFRYFDSSSDTVDLALVRGFGDMQHVDDEYCGYYDLYVCQGMEILKVYSEEEVINMCLALNGYRAENFLKTFKLTKNQIKMFKETFKDDNTILKYIAYYQEGYEKAFIEGVDVYGQDSYKGCQRKQLKKY